MSLDALFGSTFNTSSPEQNGRHFADDIFPLIFSNGNCCILIQISYEFVPMVPIYNKVSIGSGGAGDKPLPEPMISLFTDAYMRHQAAMGYHKKHAIFLLSGLSAQRRKLSGRVRTGRAGFRPTCKPETVRGSYNMVLFVKGRSMSCYWNHC